MKPILIRFSKPVDLPRFCKRALPCGLAAASAATGLAPLRAAVRLGAQPYPQPSGTARRPA